MKRTYDESSNPESLNPDESLNPVENPNRDETESRKQIRAEVSFLDQETDNSGNTENSDSDNSEGSEGSDESDNSENSEGSDNSDESDASEVDMNVSTFMPSIIEKQIIRKSLAMICRSNMSDWNTENGTGTTMILRELCVLTENEEAFSSQLITELLLENEYTYCKVSYNLNGFWENIYLSWETEFTGSYEDFDTITLCRKVPKSFYLIFTKMTKEVSKFKPRDCIEDSWCFFDDARKHLSRIALN